MKAKPPSSAGQSQAAGIHDQAVVKGRQADALTAQARTKRWQANVATRDANVTRQSANRASQQGNASKQRANRARQRAALLTMQAKSLAHQSVALTRGGNAYVRLGIAWRHSGFYNHGQSLLKKAVTINHQVQQKNQQTLQQYRQAWTEDVQTQSAMRTAQSFNGQAHNLNGQARNLSNQAYRLNAQAQGITQEAEAQIDSITATLSDSTEALQANINDRWYVTFYRVMAMDASGRVVKEMRANGLVTTNTFEASTGHLTGIKTGFGYVNDLRNIGYGYDALGNVTWRRDAQQNLTDSFSYDLSDRIIGMDSTTTDALSGLSASQHKSYQYDSIGNMTHKSDVGYYAYGMNQPHAVIRAGNNTYRYDANGNLTNGAGKTIEWNSANKPTRFEKGGYTSTFQYGPNRSRIIKTVNSPTESSRTLYLGKLYEKVRTTKDGVTKTDHKHYLFAQGQVIAIHIEHQDSGLDETRYLFHDALGSVDTITDGLGNVIERMSYDPFGQRRTVGSTQNLASAAAVNLYTHRGYTGHEHVDEMGLIHMNGRVFDPTLGRFLSADPTVDGMWGVAGYNRYSYVRNNPLKYTDPSGFKKFWEQDWFKKAVTTVVVIAASVVTGGAVAAAFMGSSAMAGIAVATGSAFAVGASAGIVVGAVGGFTAGALSAGLSGGGLKDMMRAGLRGAKYGAISGGVAGGVTGAISAGVDPVFSKMVGNGASSLAMGGGMDGFAKAYLMSAFTQSSAALYKQYTNYSASFRPGKGLPTDSRGIEGRYDETWPLAVDVVNTNISGFNTRNAFMADAGRSGPQN